MKVEVKFMFCKSCGREIPDGSIFCPSCGTKQGDDTAVVTPTNTQKSAILAGILGLCFGGLGVHNFYLGDTTKGIIQLVLSLTLICCVVSGIWAFVEAIMLLTGSINTDSDGRPLSRNL